MKHFAMAMLAFGMMLATVSLARADNTSCTGTLVNTTINGNLVVPDSASCELDHVAVTGNVLVGHDASLLVDAGVTITGNVHADHCGSVVLESLGVPSSVAGNVEIQYCTASSRLDGRDGVLTIGGNFDCHNNF